MTTAASALKDSLPPFDVHVPDSGYRWWYIDGTSECRQHGIVIIAFIGSVFSPYYYHARARERGNPYDYCSLNVAVYGPRRHYWSMTERAESSLSLSSSSFRIGRSCVHRSADQLVVDIDERTAPLAQRIRGQVRLTIAATNRQLFELDSGGRHSWQPIAPSALIDVQLSCPSIAWRGHGYLDSNAGSVPLEADFGGWDWCRVPGEHGIGFSYDVVEKSGSSRSLALQCRGDGVIESADIEPRQSLGRTGWLIERHTRCPESVRVDKTLEDTPFYARSILRQVNDSGQPPIMHETLSLDRFRQPWVRAMLPFRMPRNSRRV